MGAFGTGSIGLRRRFQAERRLARTPVPGFVGARRWLAKATEAGGNTVPTTMAFPPRCLAARRRRRSLRGNPRGQTIWIH